MFKFNPASFSLSKNESDSVQVRWIHADSSCLSSSIHFMIKFNVELNVFTLDSLASD